LLERIVFLGSKTLNYRPLVVALPIDLIIIIALANPKLESISSRSIKINYLEISSLQNKHIAAKTSSISFNSTQNLSKIILLTKKLNQKDYIIPPKRHLSSASSNNNLMKLKKHKIQITNSTIVNFRQEMIQKEMRSPLNLPVSLQLLPKMPKMNFSTCFPQHTMSK